ncbi:hypothetical protein J3F83DRAFT_745974 [Trichoderma novae-zelandiae]
MYINPCLGTWNSIVCCCILFFPSYALHRNSPFASKHAPRKTTIRTQSTHCNRSSSHPQLQHPSHPPPVLRPALSTSPGRLNHHECNIKPPHQTNQHPYQAPHPCHARLNRRHVSSNRSFQRQNTSVGILHAVIRPFLGSSGWYYCSFYKGPLSLFRINQLRASLFFGAGSDGGTTAQLTIAITSG